MKAKITRKLFLSEVEAIAEIEAAGYFPITVDVPAVSNDPHWHDFDSMSFVHEGSLQVTEVDSGEVYQINAGDKTEAKAGVIHHETHDGFRATFGFSVDPTTLTMPIDKPVVEA
jgi:hypothetical protein